MGVFDTATPAGSDPISQGDDRIRELKTAIQEFLRGGGVDGDEAIFPGPNPTTAPVFHYRGLKGSTAARPAATYAGIYWNTTTGTIQRANGSSWEDMTENAAYEAIHQAVAAALASVGGVVTLPETSNAFNVTGTEAVTSIAGWSAGVVIIKWSSARTITHSASLALRGSVNRVVAANDVSIFMFSAADTCREIGFYGAGRAAAGTAPTRQTFLSGSGTYTTPPNVAQIRVRVIGGGGGGGGSFGSGGGGNITSPSAAGSDSSFNSVVAKGGSAGGSASGTGVAGGAGGTGGSGSATLRVNGGGGGGSCYGSNAGAQGGNSALGGGAPAQAANGAGIAGAANTGGGGGGSNGASYSGSGGGAGEYVELVISDPAATYAYAVGAGGAGAVSDQAGGNGGAGGSGVVIVDEIY